MMWRFFRLALGMAVVGFPAAAQDEAAAEASVPQTADCYVVDEWKKIAISSGDISVNNFSLTEGRDFMSGMTALQLSYSIANRSSKRINISGDFVLLNGQSKVLAAMSADPLMRQVQPGTTVTAQGSTFVAPGTLPHAHTVCFKLWSDADWGEPPPATAASHDGSTAAPE